MADTEFELFRHRFDRLVPDHIQATAQSYTLVHDLALDDDGDGGWGGSGSSGSGSSSARSDSEEDGGPGPGGGRTASQDAELTGSAAEAERRLASLSLDAQPPSSSVWSRTAPAAPTASLRPQGQRRRRRLPEIPKSAKSAAAWSPPAPACHGCSGCGPPPPLPPRPRPRPLHLPQSLAAELGAAGAGMGFGLGLSSLGLEDSTLLGGGITRPLLVLKCAGLDGHLHMSSGSPDSPQSAADTLDSGHSTLHSPKSMSPQHHQDSSLSPGSPSSGMPFSQMELLEATHRGLYKFVPRHRDEMEVEIGDLIYVQKEAEDLWCEGVNLRTGRAGAFPSAYAVDLEYAELDPSEPRVRRERFLMRYLGSVESTRHKGTAVLAAAVRKMVKPDGSPNVPSSPCVLEVSDKGLRMSDSGRGKRPASAPPLDYFYSLKHVSFCAFLPRDQRYLGFITKHPQLQRFACHVFLGQESTRPVAESVGRAFQRFYQKYVETAFPIEDIYID